MTKSNLMFFAVCLAGAMFLGGYIYRANTRATGSGSGAGSEKTATRPADPRNEKNTPAYQHNPGDPSKQVFFRYNGVDAHYGQIAFAPLDALEKPKFIDGLTCEVTHVAGGRGICLSANRGLVTTYEAKLFDARTYKILSQIPLKGVPSRCRMSIDGKLAGLTIFLSGHGYESLDFSTQTLLIDVEAGKIIADLEKFSATRDGQPFSNKDFNYWGVSFTPDSRQFYATLSTNQQHFLVRGDIAKRSVIVIHENVECPSLSPDAARIAYKKRIIEGGRIMWQISILDLATDRETPLSEKRSVDDQLAWLDNEHVLYSLPEIAGSSTASTDVWLTAANGATPPRIFLHKAYSPSISPLL
jgi:hypothetical protein